LKVQKSPPGPFSLDEVDAILQVIEKKYRKELADYFEYACFTGLRSSAQIALFWQDVDLRSGLVLVRRARVLAQDKERTATTVEREVELNSRARAVIEHQRSITQLSGRHVFHNPFTEQPWNDEQTQRRRWTSAPRIAGIRDRPPKECRNIGVTLSLMAGADPVWVSKQQGHSLQVMIRDYAKWIKSPNFEWRPSYSISLSKHLKYAALPNSLTSLSTASFVLNRGCLYAANANACGIIASLPADSENSSCAVSTPSKTGSALAVSTSACGRISVDV